MNFATFIALSWLSLTLCARVAAAQPDQALDLTTPRRAAVSFVSAAEAKDWQRARTALEGGTSTIAARRSQAAELAPKLAYLLSRSITFDLDALSDAVDGKVEDGPSTEEIDVLRFGDGSVPVVLRRLQTQPPRWVFSSATLARVPELYEAHGPNSLARRMPPGLQPQAFGMARWQWLGLALATMLAIGLGRALTYVLSRTAGRIAARTRVPWDDDLVRALRGPGRLFLSVVVFVPLVSLLALPGNARLIAWRVAATAGLAALAWFAIRTVSVVSKWIERKALDAAAASGSPLATRGVQTQVRVMQRVATLVIATCAGAVILMQFDVVRSVGVSLLASAGVAGIVLGLAAQRTLGSLFAGIQLSITQPIRMGDEVIVENEFGTIEEITLTYVVVRIWDERRLIVPMARFLEQPFQNWTKVSAQLHGTVMLYTDYALPIDALRAKLDEVVTDNPLWDGRTKVVHVTDAKERTLEIRVLVSAASAGTLFGLRAHVRERLVAWLSQFEGGRYLPRVRVDGSGTAATEG